ncbi:MAG: hypothetical protein K8R69_09850 [Deltaproteobacteria bacterium]|nr:hypothetical protein [Deltaproteobacteria bacterium]
MPRFQSIFSPSTSEQRRENFESYWEFTQKHGGNILESEKDLTKKKALLRDFQDHPVRSRQPLQNPELFYRNYVTMKDDPKTLDRKTLLLTCIYKFARHEWVGISGAWDAIPSIAESRTTTEKISRHHLCEEFCHVRLFHEMFRTFHLDKVEWVPLGPWMQKVYRVFPKVPESLMSPPAFISELMGMTFYLEVDRKLDEVFADEPEARDRLRALLHEIMVDELAHIGQRRNFIGPVGIKASKRMVRPMIWAFFKDIPEAKYLLDIPRMIQEGLDFDYSVMRPELIERSWIPTYCQSQVQELAYK